MLFGVAGKFRRTRQGEPAKDAARMFQTQAQPTAAGVYGYQWASCALGGRVVLHLHAVGRERRFSAGWQVPGEQQFGHGRKVAVKTRVRKRLLRTAVRRQNDPGVVIHLGLHQQAAGFIQETHRVFLLDNELVDVANGRQDTVLVVQELLVFRQFPGPLVHKSFEGTVPNDQQGDKHQKRPDQKAQVFQDRVARRAARFQSSQPLPINRLVSTGFSDQGQAFTEPVQNHVIAMIDRKAVIGWAHHRPHRDKVGQSQLLQPIESRQFAE